MCGVFVDDNVNGRRVLIYWGMMLLWLMGVGFDNNCIVSEKWNVSRVTPRLYGWIYKTLGLSPLVVEHSVAVMMDRLNLMGSQFSIPVSWNLCSESVAALNFWDPVEYSNTGGLSSVIIRMEYLLAFQYWYWELWAENRRGGGRKHCFVNFCPLAVLESLVDEGWRSNAESVI